MAAGKGDKNRVQNLEAYRNSPLWDNLGKKKYDSWSDFSSDYGPIMDAYENASQESQGDENVKLKTYLFLDDLREVQHAHLHDYRKTLTQVSGIPSFKWDIVRTYDDFVKWIDINGIPDVVSFDIDLDPYSEVDKQDSMHCRGYYDHNELDQKTGIHCAEYLVEKCKEFRKPLPEYYIHSANALGRPVLKAIMESARPFLR
jgi:hypothetical protein